MDVSMLYMWSTSKHSSQSKKSHIVLYHYSQKQSERKSFISFHIVSRPIEEFVPLLICYYINKTNSMLLSMSTSHWENYLYLGNFNLIFVKVATLEVAGLWLMAPWIWSVKVLLVFRSISSWSSTYGDYFHLTFTQAFI